MNENETKEVGDEYSKEFLRKMRNPDLAGRIAVGIAMEFGLAAHVHPERLYASIKRIIDADHQEIITFPPNVIPIRG